MPSNFNLKLEARLIQHFTAATLVEFLDIPIEDILDRFQDIIEDNIEELLDETA